MKYQCTKCGKRRVSLRPPKASCKEFEIADAQTPQDPTPRSFLRRFISNGRGGKTARLRKYHENCPPNYHKFDFVPVQKTVIKAT